jgi:hypothetical protein
VPLEILHSKAEPHVTMPARIMQRYLTNPLLLKGKKFDIRAFALIASTTPLIALYGGPGYCRLSVDDYHGADVEDTAVHLTNQSVQKNRPDYRLLSEDTTWSMDRMNNHLNAHGRVPTDWTVNELPRRIKQIMTQVFRAIDGKLDPRDGIFDLLGFDFMVDEQLNVWLIEVNRNPSLATNSEVLRDRVTKAVSTTLDIVLEMYDKRQLKQPILPFTCDVGEMELLVSDETELGRQRELKNLL